MTPLRITGVSVATPDGPRCVTFTLHAGRLAAADPRPRPGSRLPEFDGTGLLAVPGFIDLQINGGHGMDLTTDPQTMWQLGEILPRYGVTAFLPTLISGPAGTIEGGLAALRSRPRSYRGAEPLGLHLEGPMLSRRYRGAHPADHLREPGLDLIGGWTRDGGVLLVTLAPELRGATDVIRRLARNAVIVAAGHTGATAEQALEAIGAGVCAVTHVFNAMAPLHHRHPNLVGVALTDERVVAGIVADGVHTDPLLVALVWKSKGADSLVLITDAVAALGMPEGSYTVGGEPVNACSSGVRRPDGTLAGSALSMIQAVRNFVRFTGCSLEDAVRCASTNPAALLGINDRGHLRPGAVADVMLLDEHLEVVATICRGKISFVAAAHTDRSDLLQLE